MNELDYSIPRVTTVPTECLRLGRMTYVPTYQDRTLFAVPGGSYVHRDTLVMRGATPLTQQLWSRA